GRPELRRHYDDSRTWFREETDYPGPRTMRAAARWLAESASHHERFFLFVDEFDPHEPFDTPEPWAHRYDPGWEEELMIWPPYAIGGVEKGVLTEREGRHLRCNYGSKLSMIDHWFGRVLDALDAGELWGDTAVIVCTDHGHYLGEKDLWGKPGVMQYEPLGHTPLLIHWPGAEPGSCDALTTNVDLFATAADVFGVEAEHRTHGVSLAPLLCGDGSSVREWALGGIYGNWVQVTDGRRKYARAPANDNFPLSMWSNRWSTMPVDLAPGLRLPKPDERAFLDTMPGSRVPVIRQPFAPGDMLPYWAGRPRVDAHELYDLELDPAEEENRTGEPVEKELIDLLRAALESVESPAEQLERLGIA
ncbi:MAG: sulfatase-like hydrolase/transferase, partial [Myxococcota bacterium]|nr:sulfatase-like hydrolase/transferase [Myxococcota bacterium]